MSLLAQPRYITVLSEVLALAARWLSSRFFFLQSLSGVSVVPAVFLLNMRCLEMFYQKGCGVGASAQVFS